MGSFPKACGRRTPAPDLGTLEELARRCPGRLAGRVEEACREEGAHRLASALLFNKS